MGRERDRDALPQIRRRFLLAKEKDTIEKEMCTYMNIVTRFLVRRQDERNGSYFSLQHRHADEYTAQAAGISLFTQRGSRDCKKGGKKTLVVRFRSFARSQLVVRNENGALARLCTYICKTQKVLSKSFDRWLVRRDVSLHVTAIIPLISE